MAEKIHDDDKLFELITMEGMAAGLNRKMVQGKKDSYVRAFHKFNVKKVAAMGEGDIDKLMESEGGVIRNSIKLNAIVSNARAIRSIQEDVGSFSDYVWDFWEKGLKYRDGKGEEIAHKMSDDMKLNGFKFVGPSACYIFMVIIGFLPMPKEGERRKWGE
jgi:DNA-3-methyladenine glycosylase I